MSFRYAREVCVQLRDWLIEIPMPEKAITGSKRTRPPCLGLENRRERKRASQREARLVRFCEWRQSFGRPPRAQVPFLMWRAWLMRRQNALRDSGFSGMSRHAY